MQDTRQLLFAVAAAIFVSASSVTVAEQRPAFKTFDPRTDPDFEDYENIVRRFVAPRSSRRSDSICVVGLADGSTKLAWVIWSEGRKVVLWEPGQTDLARSRRQLDTRKDVVESDAELQGSTYRVTKAWLEALTSTCRNEGVAVTIRAGRSDGSRPPRAGEPR